MRSPAPPALLASLISAASHAGEPPCAPSIKPALWVSFDEYYPSPCIAAEFSARIEAVITTLGRVGEVSVTDVRAEHLADEQVLGWVRKWLLNSARFVKPDAPCAYTFRLTFRHVQRDSP